MFFFVVPHFLHVRHVRELFFESAYQPLKQAALSGNGHDDARRAMDRMLETECFSRIASAPEKFNVPSHYFDHPGIAKQLKESAGLWTGAVKDWRVEDGANAWQIEASRTLSLTLSRTVRRSLALHACEGDCRVASAARIEHRSRGQWHVLGRASLYPAISG